jgi:hypothetical protein
LLTVSFSDDNKWINQNLGKSKSRQSNDHHIYATNDRDPDNQDEMDRSAEELKDENAKPYKFISENAKNEILSKMKSKEKPGWINGEESSNSLSYSKVLNASSRDY